MAVAMQQDKRRRMASVLNLHPELPDSWPLDLIDHLIWVEENRPAVDFYCELQRVTRCWP